MSGTFRLLIHSRLHEALQKEARAYLAPLAKTLCHLQLGYWSGGTRVKKLRGHARPVFEARLNDAARVIFTLAHTASSEPPHEPAPHILVWDILSHDAVDRRRFNPQPEASFVEFPVTADCAIESPPAHAPAAIPDALSPETLRQSLDAPRPDGNDDIGEAIRWYVLDPSWVLEDSAWQAVLDAGADAELKLTREQYDVLRLHGPVLLSGAAGSGKTTLTVHWLARHCSARTSARLLYITYSDLLLEQVRAGFDCLLRLRGIATATTPDFLTFPDLYRRLTGSPQTPVRFPRFADWYARMTSRTDAALAWEEIRGILKGACLEPERAMLSRDDYEALGRKRAPLYAGERSRLFAIGQRYQQWLTSERQADDIDLARSAWRALKTQSSPAYDAIVCDEVQDLTEVEMTLLLALCRDPTYSGLLVTGDPQQIVNPSGFRWAELRSLFMRKFRATGQAVPDVRRLTRNFRSVRGIIALANALLAVQRARTGRSDDDFTEDGVTHGAAPFVVRGDPAAVLAAVRQFGPRCAVLVARPEQADRLRRDLGTTRVFDVASSKGLEFDAVVLWNFMEPDEPVWRDILTGTAGGKEDPVMRRVLHHAYVAVTRARQWLTVFEAGRAADLWDVAPLRACLEHDTPAALQAILATASTPDDWAREAVYYADRHRYLQAAECYRRAGRHADAEFAEAKGLDEAGRFRDAAETYHRLGRLAEAAVAWAKAGDGEHAAAIFHELGQPQRAEAVLLEHWTRNGAWSKAAEIYERRGLLAEAADSYAKAGQPAHAARLRIQAAQSAGDWALVGRLEAERHRWTDAAEAFDKAGLTRDAMRCRAHQAEHEGHPVRAAELWRAAGDEERARQLVASSEDLTRRAAALERKDSHSLRRALSLWQQLQTAHPTPATENRIRAIEAELKHDWTEAAERFYELRLWENVKRVADSARSAYAGRGTRSANESQGLFRIEDLRDLAGLREIEETRGPQAAVRAAARLPRHTHIQEFAAELAVKAGLWADAMRTFVFLGRMDDARQCAVKSGDPKLVAELDALTAESKGRWADAEQFWMTAGNPRRALTAKAMALEAAGSVAEAAEAWALAGQRAKANRLRKRLWDAERQATGAYLPPGKARTDAMLDYILKHPRCTRKQVQSALNLTSGETQPSWYALETDPRVGCYRWGNTRVYGPAGWAAKAPISPPEVTPS